MSVYLITGATGLLGRELVHGLMDREATERVYCLVRPAGIEGFERIFKEYGADERLTALPGDVTQPTLGLADLPEGISDFFHAAALYDLDMSCMSPAWRTNVVGTDNALAAAERMGVARFHHISSNGVAGRFVGRFFEWMLEEGQKIDHPYFFSKAVAERAVRSSEIAEMRIYRPGIIVGHSVTGATPKADGPYFAFDPLRRLARILPSGLPLVGPEGGLANVVPVDFVADAILHIAHNPREQLPGDCFHIVDPNPISTGQTLNEMARALDAPALRVRVDRRYTRPVGHALGALPGARVARSGLCRALRIPPGVLDWRDFDAVFDTTNTTQALAGSGIECPPFSSYVERLIEYWQANLDPSRPASGAATQRIPRVGTSRASHSPGGAASQRIPRVGTSRASHSPGVAAPSHSPGGDAAHGVNGRQPPRSPRIGSGYSFAKLSGPVVKGFRGGRGDSPRLRERVAGKRVLVTGASRGIGEHLALRLGAHGAIVLAAARGRAELERLRETIAAAGGRAYSYCCDLSEAEATERLVERVNTEHGGVDVLINNAGRSIRRPIEESYERYHDAERTMRLNYFAAVRLILGLLPGMRERGEGHIVNVSSIGLQTHMPRFSAYNASKAALDAFSRSLAPEVAPEVRVTTVYMPLVRTKMSEPSVGFRGLPALSPAEAADLIAHALTARRRRAGSPVGLVGEICYATSPGLVERFMAITDPMLA
jgi:NAD(P)-dependent dehydrogenase (short-subunit alcohol dehydrogenase family)